MKKTLVALLLAVAMLLSIVPAMADISPALPYAGDEVTYHCVGADLVPENKENAVYGEFQKMIGNVNLDWELVPISDISTKQSVYLNSGDIPDLMWTSGNVSVVTTYGDMGYWLNLNNYKEYMPNFTWWMENKKHLAPLYAADGGLYCVVDVDPYDYMSETWFYNKTALESLGYTEAPQTWDEMHKMMLEYKAANPDGMPFVTYAWGVGAYMGYIGYILGDNETGTWYFNEDTGLWDNAVINSESGLKELVAFMNLWYSEGLIHPEFDAISQDAIEQYVLSGNWLFGHYYHTSIENEIFKGGENMPFELGTMITPAYEEGAQRYGCITVSANSLGGWGYFASAEVKQPEVMASLMDLCVSEELTDLINWGVEGISYDVDENGNKYFLDDYATSSEKQEEVGMNTIHLGRMVHNSSWFVGFAKNQAVAPVGCIAQDMLCDAFREGTLAHKLETRAKPTFTQEENDTLSLSTTPMSTYYNENLVLFITGERPMDEWDAFVEEYKSMGNAEEVLSIYNAAPQNEYDMSRNFPDFIDN